MLEKVLIVHAEDPVAGMTAKEIFNAIGDNVLGDLTKVTVKVVSGFRGQIKRMELKA